MDLHPMHHDRVLVLRPDGLIDHLSATAFEATLLPWLTRSWAEGKGVVLDLSQLEYISSAGLRVLMLAAKQAKTSGGQVLLAAPQPVVLEILEISRFTLVFQIFSSVPLALAAMP